MSDNINLDNINLWAIRQLRAVAQYQFGSEFDEILIPDGVIVTFSKNTKRIKEIWFKGERIATLRPSDGLFSLGLAGAKRVINFTTSPVRRVIVLSDVAEFIADGRNVFAKHVVNVDPNIRLEDEVIVVSEEEELLAVGRAKLPADYMVKFKRGVAVSTRHGIKKTEIEGKEEE